MDSNTVVNSIMNAAHNYCAKIDWVMDNKPDDRAELACLYAGIGGINECIKTLSEEGVINKQEEESLKREMDELFAHCQIKKTS
ncbi:MAG: hypothetical protein PF518_08330 [Spirochaetaceae bacterium]|nr:hypothetical protein [Spirochaetaceae bacterium]